jgi:four helix bundle protein
MSSFKSFTDLEVYKECRKLRINISALAKKYFPPEEKNKLTDQILCSSRGVTNCISEGYGRFYYKENIQFCRISRGSLSETLDHLITAFDERYISAEILKDFKLHIDTCGRLLNGYINYLKKSKPPKDEKDNKNSQDSPPQ